MKSLDSDLGVLSDQLERLDYVVVKHGEFVCVRLPLISSVRIYHTSERGFRFVPQVGPFKRSVGLFLTSGISVAAVAISALTFGLAPITAVIAFIGVVALAHDACRFVLTEGCLTRLQQLIAARGMSRSPLTSGQRPALAESTQYIFVDQGVVDPTSISR